MAFIFLHSKKINARKRFSAFAKATADKGKWEKDRFSKRSFSPPQLPTLIGYRTN
jgi:hypothetical protein